MDLGKYKISAITCLTLLSFYIRTSQSRRHEDSVTTHSTTDRFKNIEEWAEQCACFPKSNNGIPVSKYLPSDVDHDRLVIYLYRNKVNNQLTAYTPSWKKQGSFPDLTFDFEDRLENIQHEGVANLIGKETFPVLPEIVNVSSFISIHGLDTENLTDVPYLGILGLPTSEDPQKLNNISSQDLKPVTLTNIPPETLTVASPVHTVTTGIKSNEELNLPLGNKQWPLQEGVQHRPKSNQRQLNQNLHSQGTSVLPEGIYKHVVSWKPSIEGELLPITNSDYPSQFPFKFNSQLEKVQPIKGMNDKILNTPIEASSGLGGLVKYILPGYSGQVLPSKFNNVINPSVMDIPNLNVTTNLVEGEYLPIKYPVHPSFNDWFKNQMISIKSKRPAKGNALNFHLLRLRLIKSLNENGIRLSRNGNLYDSDGNVLLMSNLKLRPIFLSDPKDYEKLMASGKCVIPNDLPHLEAVLLTLEYPPRIIAIIPMDLSNIYISTSQNDIETPTGCNKVCETGQSECHLCYEMSRSGLVEDEEVSTLNADVIKESQANKEYNQSSYFVEEQSGLTVTENIPITTGRIKLQNDQREEVDRESQVAIQDSTIQLISGMQEDEESSILNTDLNKEVYAAETILNDPDEDTNNIVDEMDNAFMNSIFPINTELDSKYTETYDEEKNQSSHITEERSGSAVTVNIPNTFSQRDQNEKVNSESLAALQDNTMLLQTPDDPVSNNEIDQFYVEKVNEENDRNLYETQEKNEAILNTSNNTDYGKNLPLNPNSDLNADEDIFIIKLKPNVQGLYGGEIIYLNKENDTVERKDLDDFEIPMESDKGPDDEDNETLIRIVGGNPATSSGIPVSSKGRSGFIDD